MVHCRTHLLWNKLVSPQDSNALNYDEFMELKGLAKLEHLCDVHPNLGPLLNQPLSWYQGLAKLLLVKYNDQNRTFISFDGNIQHYVILHPRYVGAFMLLSIDLHTSRGVLLQTVDCFADNLYIRIYFRIYMPCIANHTSKKMQSYVWLIEKHSWTVLSIVFVFIYGME